METVCIAVLPANSLGGRNQESVQAMGDRDPRNARLDNANDNLVLVLAHDGVPSSVPEKHNYFYEACHLSARPAKSQD